MKMTLDGIASRTRRCWKTAPLSSFAPRKNALSRSEHIREIATKLLKSMAEYSEAGDVNELPDALVLLDRAL